MLRRLTPKAPRRGYTVVEVMSAMTLFAIGAAGVVSMQRVTIQGGDDARRFDMATNIAHEWEHRLQRDAMNWTQPNSLTSSSNRDTATTWLRSSYIDDPPVDWKVPVAGPQLYGYSAAFDLLGMDVAPASIERVFCTQYRLGWVADENAGANPTAILRAEIRVFWARLEYPTADCSDTTVYEDTTKRQKHHFVFVTTALRGNPTQ